MKSITPQSVLDLDQETSLELAPQSRLAEMISRVDIIQLSLDSLALVIFAAAVFFVIA